jgi:dTDP-4-amino-4,6-dideoxygalactose transaminase
MISFNRHSFSDKELEIVKKIIKSGWLAHGEYSKKFEDEIVKFTGAKYCTLVSSCTAALHLACLSLDLKKGDEVLVPAMTHTATSHAVEYTGAKAIFVDVNFITGNIDIEEIKKKITKKTRALIIVHMAGKSCELDKILKICKKNNIKLIEDCAHALGTTFKQKHVGNFGLAGCFSFYPTKQITTGEGGALITNDSKIYKKVKILKSFGIDKDLSQRKKPGEYNVNLLGYNYRMTDFQAALGYCQMIKYKKNLQKRRNIAKQYINLLKKNKNIILPSYSSEDSFFIFQILFKNKNKKNQIMKKFKLYKIGFSVHYERALPNMIYYKKKYNFGKKEFISSKNYGKQIISLPVYPDLKKKEIVKICGLINSL